MAYQSKRKTLIVNRQLQLSLMIYMFGLAFMSSLTTAAALQITSVAAYTESTWLAFLWIAILSIGMVLSWGAVILVFSNKIFGPLYRLHKEIRKWKNNEPVEVIKLRKGDHFTDLIDDFNEIIAKH